MKQKRKMCAECENCMYVIGRMKNGITPWGYWYCHHLECQITGKIKLDHAFCDIENKEKQNEQR